MLQGQSKPRKFACILNKAAGSPSTSPSFWKNCALFIFAIHFLRVSTASGACTPCRQCKHEGLMNRTAKFVTDRSSCASDDKVIDLTKFPTVCDLTCCPVSTYAGFYHKLVDCMVPSLLTLYKAMLNRDVAKAAIIPDHLADFYDIIIPHSSLIERILHGSKNTACYIVASDQAVVNQVAENADLRDLWKAVYASQAWTAFQESVHRGLASQSEAGGTSPRAARHRRLPRPGGAGSIAFVQRHGSRVFDNANDIIAALHAAFPDWHVQIFHGNETAAQTMAMFAQSKVVIGYHGAGLANALFSPAGTIVLEFTTMKDVDSMALWRTNAAIERIHSNLTWIQHAVDLDRLDNGQGSAGAFVDAVRATPDRDHFIKDIKYVHISSGVMFNAFTRLKREMNIGM